MFTSILVPVDFSEGSSAALRLAVRLARAHKARLTLLHVGVTAQAVGVETFGMPVPQVFVELNDQLARERQHALEKLAREEVPEDVPRALVVRDGYPPEEILAQAETGGHDLLVMATHGRTGLKRVLLGSVAERVLRSCPIPVLVTR
ncbi:MAG: universal stress protein [Myxococcota bacterium]